jgi:hypothetical protein
MTNASVDDLQEQLRQCKERHLLAKLKAPRYWFARATVAIEVLVCLVLVTFVEDRSMTAQAIHATGDGGWVLMAGVAFCCCVCLLDVLVNDLLPDRFSLPTALTWRHLGLMGIALQLAALGVLVVFAKGYTVLLLAYWVNAALAGALAYLDAFARLRRCP